MNALVFQRIAELIRQADHIVLLADERIDGDTVGCTLALGHVLNDLGKRVDILSPKAIPDMYAFLPGMERVGFDENILRQPTIDLVIVSDSSDGGHLPRLMPLLPRKVPLVSFDHHGSNPRYANINCIDPDAASTADLLWRFLKSTGLPVNREAAQCILAGICFDTQAFFSQNTTGASMEAAVELTKLGANLHEIVRRFFMNKSAASLKLWGIALERLFYDETFDAIATAITPEDIARTEATTEDIEGLSNFINAVLSEDHEVVVFYRETDDGHVKGSVRSRGRDVAKQAERLYGGGGHKLAAGFKIKNARLKEREGKWVVVPKEEPTGAPNFVI